MQETGLRSPLAGKKKKKKLEKKLKSEVSYSRKWYPVSANGASRAQLKYEGKMEYEN